MMKKSKKARIARRKSSVLAKISRERLHGRYKTARTDTSQLDVMIRCEETRTLLRPYLTIAQDQFGHIVGHYIGFEEAEMPGSTETPEKRRGNSK